MLLFTTQNNVAKMAADVKNVRLTGVTEEQQHMADNATGVSLKYLRSQTTTMEEFFTLIKEEPKLSHLAETVFDKKRTGPKNG